MRSIRGPCEGRSRPASAVFRDAHQARGLTEPDSAVDELIPRMGVAAAQIRDRGAAVIATFLMAPSVNQNVIDRPLVKNTGLTGPGNQMCRVSGAHRAATSFAEETCESRDVRFAPSGIAML